MAISPQQQLDPLTAYQQQLVSRQDLFGSIPEVPQINPEVQQMIAQQRARDTQTEQMQGYFEPRDYSEPQNFREGAANVFQRVLLRPLQEGLGLRESPEDRYTRYKTDSARAELAIAQEQRRREAAASSVASRILPNLSREDQQAFALAELTTPGSGLKSLQEMLPTGAREFDFYQNLSPKEQQEFLRFQESKANRTNIQNTPNIYKKLQAEDYFANRERVYSAARTARTTNADISQMQDLLNSGVDTGFGSEFVLGVRRAAQFFGFDDDEGIMGAQVAGAEAYIGLSNKIILPQVKQLGVNPTDKDLNFIKAGSADLGKSLAGNLLMLEALRFSNDRAIMMADAQTKWETENSDLLDSNPSRAARLLQQHMFEVENSDEFLQRRIALRAAKNRILGGDDFAEDDAALKMYNGLRGGR